MSAAAMKFHTVIVGSGAAGLSVADRLLQEGIADIAVVTDDISGGTSRNAGSDKQTYYKGSFLQEHTDGVASMAETLFCGGSMDGDIALSDAALSVRAFMRLVEYGVPFPSNDFGVFVGYRTDHDFHKRATSAGPYTSKYMTEALHEAVKARNMAILDGMQLVSLLKNRDGIFGLLVLDKNRLFDDDFGLTLIFADNVVLATGAPSGIYRDSVFPKSQWGATGAAIKAGARLCNFSEWQYGIASVHPRWNLSGSYQQVIPNYFSLDKEGKRQDFLYDFYKNPHDLCKNIFLKGYQWPFDSAKIDGSSRLDLLIHDEIFVKGRRVYIDFTENPTGYDFDTLNTEAKEYLIRSNAADGRLPKDRLKSLNPSAIGIYVDYLVDLTSQPLEITVAAQHNNGGLAVDLDMRTSISGLYASGECAGTFGIYRPGGSALNATQTASIRISKSIKMNKRAASADAYAAENERQNQVEKIKLALASHGKITPAAVVFEVQKSMSESAGIIRKADALPGLIDRAAELLKGGMSISDARDIPLLYRAEDVLYSARGLLYAIAGTMKITGSRGGALYLSEGKTAEENKHYRAFKAVTQGENTEFVSVKKIPKPDEWFESVWNRYIKR